MSGETWDRAKGLEDVRRIVLAYPVMIDRGDIEGVAQLFEGIKMCTMDAPDEDAPRLSADDIRSMYAGVILYDDGLPHTKHVITNIDILFSEDGQTATSRSHYSVLQGLPDFPLQVIITGRYEDTFRFDGEAWKLSVRREAADIVGDLSRHVKPELLAQIH
jgi:SnoaL-like domain